MIFKARVPRPTLAPGSRRFTIPIALLLLLLWNCGRPGFTVQDVFSDPELVALDYGGPFTDLTPGRGSLFLASGWSFPSGTRDKPDERSMVWGIDGESTILFQKPDHSELEFYARCHPFHFDGAPLQEVSLWKGEQKLGSAPIPPGWQTVRIPLRSEFLDSGLNEVRIVYAYSTRPSDVSSNPDSRNLSVAFESMSVVPRRKDNLANLQPIARYDQQTRRLTIPRGARIATPLAPDRDYRISFGKVASACSACEVKLEIFNGTKLHQIVWKGPPATTSQLVSEFSTGPGAIHRMVLSVSDPGTATSDEPSDVDMEIPRDFLQERPRSVASRSTRKPHIFIYLIDTMRAASLGVYGNQRPASPNIDSFAREATLYRHAWSTSAWTLPAVVSLFTGTHDYRNRMMKANSRFTGDPHPPVASLLAAAGYDTIGISQSYVASGKFGLDTGFDQFILGDQLHGAQLRSGDLRSLFWQWAVSRSNERPIFAYLHSVDPHAPYTPNDSQDHFSRAYPQKLPPEKYSPITFMTEGLGSDPENTARLKALYEDEVLYSDSQFGAFIDMLKRLGLFEQSLIILVSDHGEEFSEHEGFEHGRTLYEELLHVPLIIKYPDDEMDGRSESMHVSLTDVMPTILDVAGIDASNLVLDGRSLRDPQLPRRRLLYAELASDPPVPALSSVSYRAIAFDDLKCIETLTGVDQFGKPIPRFQTFDLSHDPTEQVPLTASDARARQCQSLLERVIARQPKGRSSTPKPSIGEEERRRLRALGYIQ